MSRFVSGGTIPGEAPEGAKGVGDTSTEWAAVQRELEEARRARAAAGATRERSLYEVLEANKAAKQAAFEEQNKIRNQFRALDDDEIEFLDEDGKKAAEKDEKDRKKAAEKVDEGAGRIGTGDGASKQKSLLVSYASDSDDE
ncbi:hypothetical protein E4U53_001780 [Claviceps sorghi]|nr:hypothetical protein E4U53_001780 [Claviceps sorghi]